MVTDVRGNRISDMKREEFVVLEDGQKQEMAVFEHVRTVAGVMKPSLAPNGVFTNQIESGSNRLTIIVFDLFNSRVTEQLAVREELLRFLTQTLNVGEPLCLIALDANGLQLIHDFTQDPAVLADALKNLKLEGANEAKVPSSPIESQFRMVQGWNSESQSRVMAMTQARLNYLRHTEGMAKISSESRSEATLWAMQEIAEAFIGIPGRKSLIWATGGFPFDISDSARFGRGQLLPAYERAWRAFNLANVAVYPLDVRGLIDPSYVNPAVGTPLPQHIDIDTGIANMANVADITGGKLCTRAQNAVNCVQQASIDSSDYYMLGFYEGGEHPKPGWRKLKVQTLRAGTRIQAKTGFYVGGPIDAKTSKEEIEFALSSPFDYTELPISVQFIPAVRGQTSVKRQVGFIYSLRPSIATVEESKANHLSLIFAALAKDALGKPKGTFSNVVEGDLAKTTTQQIEEKGVVFTGTMELEPGEYALTFLVRDNSSGRMGTVSAPLKVD